MYDKLDTPIGELCISFDETSIDGIFFLDERNIEEFSENEISILTKTQLKEYFDGTRKEFDLPISVEGTDFQKSVWNELNKIPYGTTVTYKDIATKIGNPKAVRAVGGANHKNKISIVVPCHRVVGINKNLVGYAGGLDRKKFLLDLEAKK